MNCQDIARILDDQDIGRLTGEEQQAVNMHLAACHECAHEWDVHAQLSAATIPAMPQGLRAHCRTLAAAAVAAAGSGGRARARSRFILASTLLVAAAAAAVLGVQRVERVRGQVSASAPGPARAVPAPAVPHATKEVSLTEVPRPSPGPSSAATPTRSRLPGTFTVAVMPLADESDDPAIKVAAETYYDTLLRELQALPNLVLVAAQSGTAAHATPADYLVTITSGRSVEHQEVPVIGASGNFTGQTVSLAPRQGRWRADIKVDIRQSQAGSNRFTTTMAGSIQEQCPGTPGVTCSGPVSMASNSVEVLRKQVFPMDSSVKQALQAQLRDSGLPALRRQQVLAELQRLIDSGRVSGWESADIRAAMDYVRSVSPPQRAFLLLMLRGIRHPDLAQPLIDFMRLDASDDVRLEAAMTLAQDFGREPAVRAALEAAARNDSRQIVRSVAQRALSGEKGWHDYVVATLRNAELNYASRLEPLTYMARTLTRAGYRSAPPASLQTMYDDEVMAGLGELLPALVIDKAQTRAADDLASLINTLGQAQHPAVKDLLLKVLRGSGEPMLRHMSGNILATRFIDATGVRAALQEAGDKHPELRQMFEFHESAPAHAAAEMR
jgi:hypothetical protein